MMTMTGRSVRLLSAMLLIVLGVFGAIQAQEDPAIPLPLNEPVTGTLDSGGAITYTFEIPVGQDAVVAYEADATIHHHYCVWTISRSSDLGGCTPQKGGGGGDFPVSRAFIIPAHDQSDIPQTVELELRRPSLEGPANYTLTAYTVTPQLVGPASQLDIASDPSQPYQVYAVDADLLQPFTVEVKPNTGIGDSLQVSHMPYLLHSMFRIDSFEEGYWFPQFIDRSVPGDNTEGIAAITLNYFGGTRFRVMVEATGGYFLQFATSPTIALPLNETITGTLDGPNARINYTFDMPVGQDVVIAYQSHKAVIDDYCIILTTPSTQDTHCSDYRWRGDDDQPTSQSFVIAANGQRAILSLSRPEWTEGPANFSLSTYTTTPQAVQPGYPIAVEFDPAHPYQVYTLDMHLQQPFMVEIEDTDDNGAFLWVANQPYDPGQREMIQFVDEGESVPFFIDSAQRDENPGGISSIQLEYFGGTAFRALVKTAGDYSLQLMPVVAQTLPENSERLLTASYQMPLQLVTLDTDVSDQVEVTFRMVEGPGALTHVYKSPHRDGNLHSALGQAGVTDTPFPLTDTISWRSTGGEVVVAVQIPPEFIRGEVTVAVTWTRTQAEE